ncbi:monocarboxylate transporter 12-B-like [Centruroides sculpturatus]|uniref:monocarboxylate transporter 12-B-like n=1 Tax=Centruroides sculpturatus TaxID=218467 RepID=UPI000C6D81C9|nr:monocarboxylate transporter 12-B-like [Centruroides sculpturatus]
MTLLPVIINQYFVKHKTTAVGIACAGATIGSFAMPPLIDYLLKEYALSGCFLLMSGIILNSLVGIALLKPPINKNKCNIFKEETMTFMRAESYQNYKNVEDPFIKRNSQYEVKEDKSSGIFIQHVNMMIMVARNPMFVIISLNYIIFFLCYMTYLMIIVDFAMDLKIEENDASFLISTFSISDMVGRLSSGWLTDRGFVKRRHLVMVTMIIIGAILSITPWMRTYIHLSVVAVIYGVLVGSTLIVFFALLEEYLGLDNLPTAVGLMTFFNGCGAFVTPTLTDIVLYNYRLIVIIYNGSEKWLECKVEKNAAFACTN